MSHDMYSQNLPKFIAVRCRPVQPSPFVTCHVPNILRALDRIASTNPGTSVPSPQSRRLALACPVTLTLAPPYTLAVILTSPCPTTLASCVKP